jgi:hypothetical protein
LDHAAPILKSLTLWSGKEEVLTPTYKNIIY